MSAEMSTAIQRAVAAYYQAIQGTEAADLIAAVLLPFTYCSEGQLRVLESEAAFTAWWKEMIHRVRAESGFARGRILHLAVDHLGKDAALVKMLSTRLDATDRPISRQKTAFILYKTAPGWRIASVVTDIEFNESEQQRNI
jgi:hypothetical protein